MPSYPKLRLSKHDLVCLARTSKYRLALFKAMIDIHKLLHHVVHGNHDAVELILKDDISLIFKRGKVTDCAGREFENVSGFEYALWALDKHMWAKMISCIQPQNEEARKIFAKLIDQYKKVKTDGVTYRLNGKTVTEKHFDFEKTIMQKLQTQVVSLNALGAKDWNALNDQWKRGIGGAQKLLPMHVVYEYCSDEGWDPVPKFAEQPKSSAKFYTGLSNKPENWFGDQSLLGSYFAIIKGVRGTSRFSLPTMCAVADSSCNLHNTRVSLNALEALYSVRMGDFIELGEQQLGLKEQKTVADQPQSIQI